MDQQQGQGIDLEFIKTRSAELQAQIAATRERHSAELAPLQEALNLCGMYVGNELDSPEASLDAVMEDRFALVEQMAIIGGRHKAELEPFGERLHKREMRIKDDMNKGGMQQCKTSAGMAFFVTKDSVKVGQWDETLAHVTAAPVPDPATLGVDLTEKWPQILEHVRKTGGFHLLNQAVNKTAVKEYIKVNKSTPPGVEYSAFKDLSWRRGKEA